MKVSSCTHSFALLALSFFTIQSASALSIDSKAVANLRPRLDGDAVVPDASSSTPRKKKCSFTPPASVAALSPGGAFPVPTVLPASASGPGSSPESNSSTLANQLSYARTYKTKCSKKTGTVYLPSATGPPESGESGDTGSPAAESGSPGSAVTAGSVAAGSGIPESNESGDSQSAAAASGQSPVVAGSAGVCGSQQTVTVTSQYTVTVTQVAQAAGSIGGNGASLSTAPADSEAGTSAGPNGGLPNASSDSGPQGAQAAASSGPNTPIQIGASAAGSSGLKRTKCSKGSASSTAVIGGSGSGSGSSPVSGGSSYGNGNGSGGASPSGSGNPSGPPYGSNATYGSAAPSGASGLPISGSTAPILGSNSTNATSPANLNGQFWAGATLGTVVRIEAIPGTVFYDYDGTTVKDPFQTLGDAGVNAVRVEGTRGQCVGPSNFDNNASTFGEELTFTLDWGCLDTQVQAASRGVAQGMRVVLTINQGFDIPAGMESYSYEQMVNEVQIEAKRQLQPFLDAKIVPDVILFENEGSDGFLFNETATGHTRGSNDGKVPVAQIDKEKCGIIPTGNMASFPQYAGYLKAEVFACNDAIAAAGYSTATVRYGLHSHGQYVQWKEATFHGPNPESQTVLQDTAGNTCSNSVIPQEILSSNASELITIMGFSAYPDPMTPVDIDSQASEAETLNRLTATLTQLQSYAESYGKYADGPFAGEYKLQSLGVEYATAYTFDQVVQEQSETALMWETVKKFPNFLGMLWYEPWYCHADWEGGQATLCHNVGTGKISGEAPTNVLKTWGAAALSPWKK